MTKPVKYFTKSHGTQNSWISCNAQSLGPARAIASRRGHNRVGELDGDFIKEVSYVAQSPGFVWRNSK